MFRPVNSFVSCSLLAFAGLVSTSANATEVCDLYTTYVSCSRECYSLIAPVITAECDLTNAVDVHEADAYDPPPAPLLKCSHAAGVSSCESFRPTEQAQLSAWKKKCRTGSAGRLSSVASMNVS